MLSGIFIFATSAATLKSDTVSIGLPAVLTKYVTGVPDLHRPGYEYPPYREAVDFQYDVHTASSDAYRQRQRPESTSSRSSGRS